MAYRGGEVSSTLPLDQFCTRCSHHEECQGGEAYTLSPPLRRGVPFHLHVCVGNVSKMWSNEHKRDR